MEDKVKVVQRLLIPLGEDDVLELSMEDAERLHDVLSGVLGSRYRACFLTGCSLPVGAVQHSEGS